jgi:hypothetical protein
MRPVRAGQGLLSLRLKRLTCFLGTRRFHLFLGATSTLLRCFTQPAQEQA